MTITPKKPSSPALIGNNPPSTTSDIKADLKEEIESSIPSNPASPSAEEDKNSGENSNTKNDRQTQGKKMTDHVTTGANGAGASDADPNSKNSSSSTSESQTDSFQPITVFHDPNNFNVKHPLINSWTLWFTKPSTAKGDNWNDLLKEVISFDSVEEFWGIYNNISPTSQLALKSDYHLFKKGVRPEWEDPQNKHGGKWAYAFKDKKPFDIDLHWLHMMLAAIGETLEPEGVEEVMGVVVNVRKGFFRIGLWTRSVDKSTPSGRTADQSRQLLLEIGRRFRKALDVDDQEVVEFTGHVDSTHGSARAKAKLTV